MFIDNLTYLTARLHRLLHGRLEKRLQEVGISVEQWRILDLLGTRDGQSMGEIAGVVLMNHSALTKIIDRMVANGLVHRAPDMIDQRRVLVHLTDRSVALLDGLRARVDAHEAEVRRMIGPQNVKAIEALLESALAAEEHEWESI